MRVASATECQVWVPKCNLCGSGIQHDYLHGMHGERLVQCGDCGFVFLNPRIREIDQADHEVEPIWIREEKWRRIDDRRRLAEIRATHPAGSLLDVGCYCGFFLAEASQAGYHTTGVEIAPAAAAYARETLGLNVHNGTVESMLTATQRFNVITMFHVLEHVASPMAVLDALAKAQDKGDLLVVEVPRLDSLVFNTLRQRHRHVSIEHSSYFTRKTLTAALAKSGYTVTITKNVGRTMSVPWIAWRLSHSVPRFGSLATRVARLSDNNWGRIHLNLGDIIRVHAVRGD